MLEKFVSTVVPVYLIVDERYLSEVNEKERTSETLSKNAW